MTRRDFRGSIEAPRPAAAWLMSIVASATLWVTELLPIWIILIQLIAFAASYGTRLHPPVFRRSPIWLNIGMLGITTVTIRSALDGNPATVSLAYFTALAQGLQLLDARPRRSEFLLVALALFQVILASNLTDSILFPPLVLLFLVSVTWTLLVHTLHMEATEAGDPSAAPRAIRADLAQMTAVATCGSLILALVLFMALPRVKTNMLRGSFSSSLALSGFSDRVRLGETGKIRKDHSTVLRVEAVDGDLPEPADAYWRGLAFDQFDGRDWSISESEHQGARQLVTGVGRFGITIGPKSEDPVLVQRIIREPVEADVLFTPGQVQRVQGPFQGLERDLNGALYLTGRSESDRIRYTVWSRIGERHADRLREDRASAPLEPAAGGRRPTRRYSELPPLDPRVAALAEDLVAGAATDYDRALQLQERLQELGRYTDEPPARGDAQTSPIEAFLLEGLEGHCEYFASAMVVLARSQGLPARLVNGFAGGVANSVGDFLEVTNADAHAWVEIHFERAGWVRFDPTPPDRRLRAMEAISLWSQIGHFGSALELWWFQRVVDFDSADQIGALRGLWLAWKGDDKSRDDNADAEPSTPQLAKSRNWVESFERARPALLIGLALAGLLWLRSARRASRERVPSSYRRALRLLAGRGWRRAETSSARDFARRVGRELPDEAAIAFEHITEHYLAERFGANPAPDLTAELALLERTVDGMRLGNQAHVG